MENLKSNVVTLYILEIVALIVPVFFMGSFENVVPFWVFWLISSFVLNIIAIVFLVRFMPKYYLPLIFGGIIIPVLPFVVFYLALSSVQC